MYYGTDAAFNEESAALHSEISKIQRRLIALSADNSSSAAAERARLNAQLQELQAEFDDLWAAKSRKNQVDALEAEKKSFYRSLFGTCRGYDYMHLMGYWVTYEEPTCESNGEERFYCSQCDFYVVKNTQSLGHYFIGITTIEPSCTALGEKTFYCANNSQHLYTEAIPMTEHSPNLPVRENEVPATCEKTGSYDEVIYCSLCGAEMSRESKTIDKLEHTFSLQKYDDNNHWNECECGVIDEDSVNEHILSDEGHCTVCNYICEEKNTVLLPFEDVSDQDYYYEAVHWAYENGITGGVDASEFAPAVSCSRAQVVTFLWRTFGSPRPESCINQFGDVEPGMYYNDAVLWAAEQGITTGTSDDTFSPDMLVTRGQFVTFLWRATGQPYTNLGNIFEDVEEGAYFADAVSWAVEYGITMGTSSWTFSPEEKCTRAQVVTFLYRASEN